MLDESAARRLDWPSLTVLASLLGVSLANPAAPVTSVSAACSCEMQQCHCSDAVCNRVPLHAKSWSGIFQPPHQRLLLVQVPLLFIVPEKCHAPRALHRKFRRR